MLQYKKFTKQMIQINRTDKALWRPRYGRYDLGIMLRRLDAISKSADTAGSGDALARSEEFIRSAFRSYEGKGERRACGFAFAVPTRIRRNSDQYRSEAAHFMPIVNLIGADQRQCLISGLPPCVIDEYGDTGAGSKGVILFVPLFSDMLQDIRSKLMLSYTVRKVIKDTALFARDRLGVELMGLGATLPKITGFGAHISRHGIKTTTGHGGTVYLMHETLLTVAEKYRLDIAARPVGCIGAGSIGESIARLTLSSVPGARIVVYDIRPRVAREFADKLSRQYGDGRVTVASSNDDVLNQSGVTFSAVTSPISVGQGVDLTGKLIIDDSQPGSFSEQDVRAHGGAVIWVVGHDSSPSRFLTRHSGYRFGEEGLLHHGDVWGCEAEVGSLWAARRCDLAIDQAVVPEDALAVGAVMHEYGIRVADMQQHGKPVDLARALRRK